MQLTAISGSTRSGSTNTALVEALSDMAPPGVKVNVFRGLMGLPIFSADIEGPQTPAAVLDFYRQVDQADGLILASPEYVRAIPGGLKNAIDWLVAGEIMINKPVALIHASHRGDDMLASLRTVLQTVTTRFNGDLFLRLSLMSKTPSEVRKFLNQPEQADKLQAFLAAFVRFAGDRLT